MVMHKKTHLNVGTAPTLSSNVAAAQKRPTSSPSKKSPSKRVKKTAAAIVKEEELAPPTLLSSGDLFDQVKRNLEAKESGHTPPASEKASGKTPGRKRAPPKSPKSPKVPAAAKSTAKSPKSPAVTGIKSNESSTTKPLLNPKKKWLKSSMQSKSEVNPEVKIKLMADWDEEEEQQQQQSSRTETSATVDGESVTPSSNLTAKQESDSEQERLSKSTLIQQKSDDVQPMETENGTSHHQAVYLKFHLPLKC